MIDNTLIDMQTKSALEQSLQARLRGLDQVAGGKETAFRKTIQDQEAQRTELRRVAEEYEAVFLSQMIAPMFEGIETDGLFGGGKTEEIYRSLLIEEYGKMAAKSGGIGMADHIYAELLRLQEGQISPEQMADMDIPRQALQDSERVYSATTNAKHY